jgi:hypothetical protein
VNLVVGQDGSSTYPPLIAVPPPKIHPASTVTSDGVTVSEEHIRRAPPTFAKEVGIFDTKF